MCHTTSASECGMNDPVTPSAFGGVPIRTSTGGCNSNAGSNDRMERNFKQTCDAWMNRLEAESDLHGGARYNTLQNMAHIGMFVCKPGCHGQGKALDIRRIKWNDVDCCPGAGDHSASDRTVRRRYLAVDAVCRMYFKDVLDGWYTTANCADDNSHLNHIHVASHFATNNIVLDRDSCPDTLFVQAVCNNFDGAGLAVDGAWGPATEGAWDHINNVWGWGGCGSPFMSHDAYEKWLHRVVYAGFGDIGAAGVPVNLDGC